MKNLTILLLFTLIHSGVLFALPGIWNLPHPMKPQIFEETINASVECVRGFLSGGIPEYGVPSLDLLILNNITVDFDQFSIDGVSGQVLIDKGIVTDIPSFVMTQIQGDFILIPPTFIVNFALHYDKVEAHSNYKANVTINGTTIWGEGFIFSGVENLNAAGHVRAVVDTEGVHILEFDAPITVEKYNFNITGLYGDEEFSKNLSETISQGVPDYINDHPEIFSDIIAPIFIDIFNALVNDDAGIGIIRYIVEVCIIDIVFPPEN